MNPSGPQPKWKIALSPTLIFVWIDAHAAHASRNRYHMILGWLPGRSFGKPNSLVRHPSALLPRQSSLFRVIALIFLAKNCHYAYTYDEVYSPVLIGRIDETNKVKEERWKVISTSFHPLTLCHTLIPHLRSASLYTTLSFFARHT